MLDVFIHFSFSFTSQVFFGENARNFTNEFSGHFRACADVIKSLRLLKISRQIINQLPLMLVKNPSGRGHFNVYFGTENPWTEYLYVNIVYIKIYRYILLALINYIFCWTSSVTTYKSISVKRRIFSMSRIFGEKRSKP